MSNNNLEITIKINSQTKELEVIKKGFSDLDKQVTQTNGTLANFANSIAIAGASIFTISKAYDTLIGKGIELNKTYENTNIAFAGLIAVNLKNTDLNGKELSVRDKINAGYRESVKIMEQLRVLNLETSATMTQLSAGMQQAMSGGLAKGLDLTQIANLTKSMTNAVAVMVGGNKGLMDMQIPQEIRGLLSGEFSPDSQVMQRLFGSSKEEKKKFQEMLKVGGDEFFNYVNEKLKVFDELGKDIALTYDGISSAISDSLDYIKRKSTEGLFNNLKKEGIDLNKFIRENTDETISYLGGGVSKLTLTFLEFGNTLKNIVSDFGSSLSAVFDDLNQSKNLTFFDYFLL